MGRWILLLLFFTLGADLSASTNAVGRLVGQLGDDSYKVREAATNALWKMGIDVLPDLERALGHEDPEVKIRVNDVVVKLKRGEIAGLPQAVLEILKRFHQGEQSMAFSKLIDEEQGLAVAWILAEHQFEDPEAAVARVSSKLRARARKHILADELDQAESCLRLRTLGTYSRRFADLAVFLALLPEGDESKEMPEVMVRRAFVRGDMDAVMEIADEGDPFHETVLRMRGDWKKLATIKEENFDKDDIRDLGLRASYHRLAGSPEQHKQALADLQAHAAKQTEKDDIWFAAEAFFLNDKFREGIAVLANAGDYRAVDLAWRIYDFQTILDFKKDHLDEEELEKLAAVQKRITDSDPYKQPEPKDPDGEKEPSEFEKIVSEADPLTEEDWLPFKRWALADHWAWQRAIGALKKDFNAEQNGIAHDWSLRIGIGDDWGHIDALRKWHWHRSVEAEDFKEAKERFERHRLALHVEKFKYNKPYYYLTATAETFYLKVLLTIAEDRREDLPALMEDSAPNMTNFNLKFSRDLRQRGHDDVADLLLDHHRRYLKAQIERFPNCAMLLNTYAWNLAISGKDFEGGLAAVERALELGPGQPKFYDSKAELLFQLKRDEEALFNMQRAAEILPDSAYYKRQIERIRAGKRDMLPE